MRLRKLRLVNFRSYKKKEFDFTSTLVIVIGPNTSGKTNLLEAIMLLATGRSIKAQLEQEMITENEVVGRVKGRVIASETTDLEIVLTRGEIQGEKVARKKYFVNGVGKGASSFVGNLKAVYFGPSDLDLVTGSPSLRRHYLETVLSQVDREYHRVSLSYEKGLRQRNKLLERIREEGCSRSQLLFWDQLLVRNGNFITLKREEFINFCNNQKEKNLSLFKLNYDKSLISSSRLADYAEEEIAAGVTLVGPHRDDFQFFFKDRDLSRFGSRGEQRMIVLWLKLCELKFISQKQEVKPILLLDDIFSELDTQRRRLVLKVIPKHQTIITTADLGQIPKNFQKKGEVIKLKIESE